MTTAEERTMILKMIEEGKISAEEGTRLLKALGSGENRPGETPLDGGAGARYMRIRVTDLVTGQQKVSVNLPVALISFGLRFVPATSGFDKQAVMDAIESGLHGRIIDVEDTEDGNHVEVFLE